MSLDELEHPDLQIVEVENVGLALDDDNITHIIFETEDSIKILDASAWGSPFTIQEEEE
jgi:hypothetical protein